MGSFLEKEFLTNCYVGYQLFPYTMITPFPSLLGKVPKKNHLMTLLDPINHKWNIISVQLQVQYAADMMSIIVLPYDNATKLSKVLQCWIDRKTCDVSWRMIITVINNCPVEEKRVADEICDFLARPEIMNEYLLSDQSGIIKMIIINKII